MNAQRDDALGPAFRQGAHAARRILAQRIEQARCFEIARFRLVGEAVFQIAVVVLVRLGVDDDRVRQAGGFHQLGVVFQRVGGRLVRRAGRVGDALGVEEVNVTLDGRGRGGGEQRAGRRSDTQDLTAGEVSHGCCYSRVRDIQARSRTEWRYSARLFPLVRDPALVIRRAGAAGDLESGVMRYPCTSLRPMRSARNRTGVALSPRLIQTAS